MERAEDGATPLQLARLRMEANADRSEIRSLLRWAARFGAPDARTLLRDMETQQG